MKLVKSLLLGSTAVLAVGAGAQAADLPSRKAAPVQYVRICDAYGAGFFYIPGTDTCLRVGGYARVEFEYSPPQAVRDVKTGLVSQVGGDQDQTGMEIRGRIDVDARTQSAWGTVRTVVNLRMTNTDGIRGSKVSNFATLFAPNGNGSTGVTMERAYVQFAGLTAGVAPENFSPLPSYLYSGDAHPGFPNGMKQLAYTATFGGGFSATLAIEDATGDPSYETSPGNFFASSFYASTWNDGYMLVGNVRDDQSWGYIQLSGAVQNDSTADVGGTYPGTNQPLFGPTQTAGYAIGIGGRFLLPMIAPGDQFNFQAQYARGLDGLLLSSGGLNNLSDSTNARFLGGVLRKDTNMYPTTVNAAGTLATGIGLETGWSVEGLYTHYWTPSWRSNFMMGYAELNPPTVNQTNLTTGLNTQWGQGTAFVTAANIIWSPVKSFDIGLEVEYLRINSVLQNPAAAFITNACPAGTPAPVAGVNQKVSGCTGLTEDGFVTHLRVERTF